MFKNELQDAIIKLMNNFYQEEQGNRVTTNVVDGITLKIVKVFDALKIEEETAKKLDKT